MRCRCTPANAYPIRELKANAKEILQAAEDQANKQLGGKVHMDLVGKICPDGRIYVEQGVVAGCSGGTYENICAVADIIRGKSCGNGEFNIQRLPGQHARLSGAGQKRRGSGYLCPQAASSASCFCGPCFGAGDIPANGEFSIRHTTRNFPNREGSKPGEGQISCGGPDGRPIHRRHRRQRRLPDRRQRADRRGVHHPGLPL